MKATEELIDALMAVAFGNKDLESQRVRLNNLCVEADKETLEFEAKAAELDRREQGVMAPYSHMNMETNERYYECRNCNCDGIRFYNSYCHKCGTKLIWPDN